MGTERVFVIIPAGGTGTRMGLPFPKQLLPFRGQPLLAATVSLFKGRCDGIWVPAPKDHLGTIQQALGEDVRVLAGGATRFQSVKRGFEAIDPEDQDLIVIHDAARPFFDPTTLGDALECARRSGAVIYASRAIDTIKQVDDDGCIRQTLDRDHIFHAQTPQIFCAGILREAYTKLDSEQGLTDEAALVEGNGARVHIFESPASNKKITQREDTQLLNSPLRIGHGYDVHRFDANRPLFLAGVHIAEGPGLAGHSDADVVLHALIDAMLGAAGRGDIGHWFPDSSAEFKDIRSTHLLERVWNALQQDGYQILNTDITVQAQVPKLAPYIENMRQSIASHLQIAATCVNVKATTTEGLGFVGKKLGMAADAVVLMTVHQ